MGLDYFAKLIIIRKKLNIRTEKAKVFSQVVQESPANNKFKHWIWKSNVPWKQLQYKSMTIWTYEYANRRWLKECLLFIQDWLLLSEIKNIGRNQSLTNLNDFFDDVFVLCYKGTCYFKSMFSLQFVFSLFMQITTDFQKSLLLTQL